MGRLFPAVLLCLSLSTPALATEPYPGPYRLDLIRVIDGDTIRSRVALWPGLSLEVSVRLAGIDAPERDQTGGAAAKAFLETLLAGQALSLHNPHLGKYAGRIVGDVTLPDGRDLGRVMVDAGYAEETR